MATVTDFRFDTFLRPDAAAPAVRVSVADGREDIPGWRTLVRRASEPNPFFERWFLKPSLQNLDPNEECAAIVVKLGDTTCGLMPITRKGTYSRWPVPHLSNWTHPNIFLGTPLVAKGSELSFWRGALKWADQHAGSSLFLHLKDIGLDGPVYGALKHVVAQERRPWGVVDDGERAVHSTDLSPEEYLARALPRRKRKDLNRRFRRLQELGVINFVREVGTDGLDGWIDGFLALEASGWKGEAGSALACRDSTSRLFRESVVGAAEEGKLLRMTMLLDGEPIAMLSTFLAPPGAFGFKTAFDEAYSRYSPGFLLERAFVEAWPEFGLHWCDSCASPGHSVMDRIWTERRRVGRVSIGIGGPVRRAIFRQLLRCETKHRPKEDLR